MKANELKVNKKYWCEWASRNATFVKLETRTWCGKTETYAIFKDVCDCIIKCKIENVEKLVIEK